ncbi:hypothetical protein [Lyngbya aestuarii]|uniref:hypothetical protein n=1 Tax=Lyngbya aestuarii TaxID=118322 RepID=UPI00403DF81C
MFGKTQINNSSQPALDMTILQELSEQEASLITGGQVTTVSELTDLLPVGWMIEPDQRVSVLAKWKNWMYTEESGWVCQPGKVC